MLITRGALTTFSVANDYCEVFRHHSGDAAWVHSRKIAPLNVMGLQESTLGYSECGDL